MNKIITDELINERLEAKGFGDKQINDEELAKKSVLKHFGVEFTDRFDPNASFHMYEESTADGYSVWVATYDTNCININEHVYYYDIDLSDALVDHIKDSYRPCEWEFPELIYVDDLEADYIDSAIERLFVYLAEKFQNETLDELQDEGYELVTIKDERYEQN
tara:strand:+ start:601 stop:1089 length:489 start_codon:yes stop_codon:yes gene_type:complete